jgi:hypothetical protein
MEGTSGKGRRTMETISIPVVVGEDRRLTIDLPDSMPTGPADALVRHRPTEAVQAARSAREIARAKLLAAGFLVTDLRAPAGTIQLSAEELARLGQLPAGAPGSEVLVDDDRGTY